jgi:EAL domain-containing protein (putative c-di-GMP-specific phosphodiesterase class I)
MAKKEIDSYFLQSLTGELTGWNEPEAKLARAFSANEFVLFSQTIAPLSEDASSKPHIEIYVRLREEEINMVPPGTFLPFLEHYNMGPRLDRYVLRRVLMWFRGHRAAAPSGIHINLCKGTLVDIEFPSYVASELKATAFAGETLCFEIPDAMLGVDPVTRAVAKDLKKLGCRIAVGMQDNAQVSFEPVKAFAADFVKIGGGLIGSAASDKGVSTRLKALAKACRAFGVMTVAQQVEDEKTLAVLKELGMDYAQGYGIARPGPLESA